jgi:hypothetical protein
MTTRPTLSKNKIIDQALSWIIAECRESGFRRFCHFGTSPCIHAQTASSCLRVSKNLFAIGARHLWSNYAIFGNLLEVALKPTGDEETNRCVSVSLVRGSLRLTV